MAIIWVFKIVSWLDLVTQGTYPVVVNERTSMMVTESVDLPDKTTSRESACTFFVQFAQAPNVALIFGKD